MIPTGRNPTEMVAVDGDTAVVRAVVREGDPLRQECTDLWLVRLDDHGRVLVRGVALGACVGNGNQRNRLPLTPRNGA
jgi:hypothetical protein